MVLSIIAPSFKSSQTAIMSIGQHLKKWWKSSVVYQIYPASFKDSNGDGVGDIQGIISKLDYIANLGVNVVWVCPHYDSPQVDMGYDISDYENVYAPYGSLADVELLIEECHARGMRIIFDLVINHTSDQHKWFLESRSSKDNPKRDWYIWQPPKFDADGKPQPPNNWRATFGGGSTWEYDPQTEEYYLHLFAKEQPDVNWENPVTRRAIYASSMEFWLERGVDGFRVDTVNMYSKPAGFADAPITDATTEFQPAHMLYCNGPRMHEFLAEMNVILAKYGAITVGELPHTPETERVLKYVSAEAKQLDMVFQFDVVDVGFGVTHKFNTVPRNYTLPDMKAAVARTQALIHGTDAWTTAFMENHDQSRSVSRFASDSSTHRAASGKLLALLQTTLSGTLYIYQGQEIGSVNAPKASYPLEEYKDIDSLLYLQHVRDRANGSSTNGAAMDHAFDALQYLARDHARIPIAWDGSEPHGGFSAPHPNPATPWMTAHPLAGEINVASQLGDEKSVLSFWKRMLTFRRENEDLLVYGDFRLLRPDDEELFMYVKEDGGGGMVLAVLNFTDGTKAWEKPDAVELGLNRHWPDTASFKLLVSTVEDGGGDDVLAPYEGRVYQVLC